MQKIADLLFEAKILKEIPRSGYHFLGAGKESVAEHSFSTAFIAYVMSQLEPEVDALKLISMCLIHDLPEARVGDLNTVHKQYVTADEGKALEDATRGLAFGDNLRDLLQEYNDGLSKEARLAHDGRARPTPDRPSGQRRCHHDLDNDEQLPRTRRAAA